MFSSGNRINPISTASLRIDPNEETMINRTPYRRLSVSEREMIRELISDLLKNAIVQNGDLPFVSPASLAKKKVCMDCVPVLNKLTELP